MKVLIITSILLLHRAACPLPIFPGAEGWGTDTPGGRGGAVYIVTNLNTSGPGSFADALMATEPRIIVFRVSGVISLDVGDLTEEQAYVTVAGQTSPGGITLTKGNGTILGSYKQGFHDGVFRFLRFRGSDDTYDNISLNTVDHIVMDHCDFSGSSDEAFDITFGHHITISWCTIANSGAGQTYGALIAYSPTSHITMHHNLFAHHVHRGGPHMHWADEAPPENGLIDYRNNVAYNNQSCRFVDVSACGGPLYWNLVGNYFKAGPNTDASCDEPFAPVNLPESTVLFESDNYWMQKNGTPSTNVEDQIWGQASRTGTEHVMPQVTTQFAQEAYNIVLDKVGAWPRDAMNERTVEEVRNGTGQLRKTDDPKITDGPQPPVDADMDGMPDEWERSNGLNPDDGTDHNGDPDGDEYTNIEEYINDLALILLGQDPANNRDRGEADSRGLLIFPRLVKAGQRVHIVLSVPRPEGRIIIYDLNGGEVANLPARYESVWDGRDSDKRPVATGQYIVKWKRTGDRRSLQEMLAVY
jgi:hypothetical protein